MSEPLVIDIGSRGRLVTVALTGRTASIEAQLSVAEVRDMIAKLERSIANAENAIRSLGPL
jgi:hypothetical protein